MGWDKDGIDWKEWEKKYPGLVKFADKDVELLLCVDGMGFKGISEVQHAAAFYIPVPAHLRKPDAGPAEIPEVDFDDHAPGYDYGIKPEIHVKYRQPPFNDPNWLHHTYSGATGPVSQSAQAEDE